jgi:hypothetical protein
MGLRLGRGDADNTVLLFPLPSSGTLYRGVLHMFSPSLMQAVTLAMLMAAAYVLTMFHPAAIFFSILKVHPPGGRVLDGCRNGVSACTVPVYIHPLSSDDAGARCADYFSDVVDEGGVDCGV